MNDQIKQHYKNLFQEHGVSAQSVQYTDHKSHYERFKVLSQIIPSFDSNLDNSILDVGCGLGHLYDFLKKAKGFEGNYLGLDFVDEFIQSAKELYKEDTNANFEVFDISKKLPTGYDYAILSGVFNNKSDNNKDFMFHTIRNMFEATNKGVAFNAMSTYVDYQDEGLFYTNPLEVFDFCKKELTKKVTLRHDYLVKENSIPFEFSIYLYK